MSVSHEVEISDLTEEAVRRLLKESWRQQAINSMPHSKRKKAMAEMEETDDDDESYCKACRENDAKVAMNRGDTKPSLPGATSDDLPKGIKIAKAKKTKKGMAKNG